MGWACDAALVALAGSVLPITKGADMTVYTSLDFVWRLSISRESHGIYFAFGKWLICFNRKENIMAQKLAKHVSGSKITLPPETDGDFDTVPTKKIAEWREKLSARFGIGQGRLDVISEPNAKS